MPELLMNALEIAVLGFYLTAAWMMCPWGPRWRTTRAELATAEQPPGRLGRAIAWLILWLLLIPIVQGEFFDHIADPTEDDEAEGPW